MKLESITTAPFLDEVTITLTVTPAEEGRDLAEKLISLKGEEVSIEAKKMRQKRSLDQNAYMWVLIKKLAKKLQVPYTEVYMKIIREGGEYEIMPIRNDAVDTWVSNWQTRGTGWVCEILGESKFAGYTNVKTYYGTSAYKSDQMARVLDIVIDECKANGIEVLSPAELARMREMEKSNGY